MRDNQESIYDYIDRQDGYRDEVKDEKRAEFNKNLEVK